MPIVVPRVKRVAGWSVALLMVAMMVRVAMAATDGPEVSLATAATNSSGWLPRQWSSEDGLPNNTVSGLAQTPDGYLWVGTPNGLARFDGVRFESYTSEDFIGPPDRGIGRLVRGQEGLWLGMDRGAIVRLNGAKPQGFTPPPDMSSLTIDSLTEDGEGGLWIAYRGGSVCRFQDGKWRLLTEADGLPAGPAICAVARDGKGRLWFAKAGQLGLVRDGKFQMLTQIDSAPTRLAAAKSGGVWVGVANRLFKFDEGHSLEYLGEFRSKREGTEPSELMESREGAVWIGTTLNGLYRFYGASFEAVPTTHQQIASLLEDAEGNVWVGTGGGGLNQVRPRAVTLVTEAAGLTFEAVRSVCEDTNGVMWAAMQDGSLGRQINGHWEVLPASTNWTADAISVCADPSGGVWVGTRFHGLLFWRDGGFVHWGNIYEIKGRRINTLVVAKPGDVWLGEDSPMAVQHVHDGKVENFELPPDLRVIRASAQDTAGNVWFGTSKGVLLRVETNRVVDMTAETTGTLQPIRYIYATPDGSVWIAYAGAGLGRMKNGHFAMITGQQGFYDSFVSQVVADDRGWLWFGANRGIFKVRQRELEAVADGQAKRVNSIHYGPADELPSLQANFGSSPNSMRSHDGKLWLTMRTALVVVNPKKMRENSPSPPVLLTQVAVGDRVVAAYGGVTGPPKENGATVLDLARAHDGLKLPPNHRPVEIQFTALSFIESENLNFRYRLKGLEDEWQDAVKDRVAVFPQLPPGQYEFQVNACNSEGIWTETGPSLSLEVTPFYWQTWWFRSGTLAAFTLIVIAIVRYVSFRRLRAQLSQLEAQAALHKERARIAKDIHDDLGANLTQISLLGELAHQDRAAPQQVGEHIEKISTIARRAVKSLDEIVWAVNPQNDTLTHFIDYTGQFALDYLRLAGIRCRLNLPEQSLERELSTDVRHNLFLVVKEAINNTVKHSHATELRLRIAVTEEKLEIMIEDNGSGFDQAPLAEGADGLRNMRQRMADIGGQCWIQGRPGAGAKVTIELVWPQKAV